MSLRIRRKLHLCRVDGLPVLRRVVLYRGILLLPNAAPVATQLRIECCVVKVSRLVGIHLIPLRLELHLRIFLGPLEVVHALVDRVVDLIGRLFIRRLTPRIEISGKIAVPAECSAVSVSNLTGGVRIGAAPISGHPGAAVPDPVSGRRAL